MMAISECRWTLKKQTISNLWRWTLKMKMQFETQKADWNSENRLKMKANDYMKLKEKYKEKLNGKTVKEIMEWDWNWMKCWIMISQWIWHRTLRRRALRNLQDSSQEHTWKVTENVLILNTDNLWHYTFITLRDLRLLRLFVFDLLVFATYCDFDTF